MDNCTAYTLCLPLSPCMLVSIACMHECLVCATMSFRPLTPPGASGRARTHALHVHIIAKMFYPRPWNLRAAGLAPDQLFWYGWVCGDACSLWQMLCWRMCIYMHYGTPDLAAASGTVLQVTTIEGSPPECTGSPHPQTTESQAKPSRPARRCSGLATQSQPSKLPVQRKKSAPQALLAVQAMP